jgi:hypothetical protein
MNKLNNCNQLSGKKIGLKRRSSILHIKRKAEDIFALHQEVKLNQNMINPSGKSMLNSSIIIKKEEPKELSYGQKCIISHDSDRKEIWDAFMSIVLIYTCFMTPLNLAFAFRKKNQ